MSKSANTVSGLMWDDFRNILRQLRDSESITRETYWELTDLVNDYGFVMKLAGMRGESTDGVERVVNSVMGTLYDTEPRSACYERYDFGG